MNGLQTVSIMIAIAIGILATAGLFSNLNCTSLQTEYMYTVDFYLVYQGQILCTTSSERRLHTLHCIGHFS
jgi:hypothetical protein